MVKIWKIKKKIIETSESLFVSRNAVHRIREKDPNRFSFFDVCRNTMLK